MPAGRGGGGGGGAQGEPGGRPGLPASGDIPSLMVSRSDGRMASSRLGNKIGKAGGKSGIVVEKIG